MQPIKLRTNAPTTTKSSIPDDLDYQEERTRVPTSAVRWRDTQGNLVMQRGNQRFVFHDEPPPRQRRRPHWLVISGLSMMVLLLLWAGLSWVSSWWTTHQLDTTYEFPRISQADAVVYPGDTRTTSIPLPLFEFTGNHPHC